MMGWLITLGSGAEAPPVPLGPVWAHDELVADTRAFGPRLRSQIIVQTGSQFSIVPADDTQRWPK